MNLHKMKMQDLINEQLQVLKVLLPEMMSDRWFMPVLFYSLSGELLVDRIDEVVAQIEDGDIDKQVVVFAHDFDFVESRRSNFDDLVVFNLNDVLNRVSYKKSLRRFRNGQVKYLFLVGHSLIRSGSFVNLPRIQFSSKAKNMPRIQFSSKAKNDKVTKAVKRRFSNQVDRKNKNPDLDRNVYETWKEAGDAAEKLGIKNEMQYSVLRMANYKLPIFPAKYYEDFPGWRKFLNTAYRTCEQASAASVALGISFYNEYRNRFREDEKLFANPDRRYKDFPGWKKFLGKK